eukprot:TRINITY_DN2149_c6_g1_i1.p1 TRINITY_DN2149_c6_g1~~TRINITY_DN2149_c6_g1_i1.p1  ORF type:complete len:685 (+),score=146.00 TRINITY_DN2149_c6_g1_i1:73-2055(+)
MLAAGVLAAALTVGCEYFVDSRSGSDSYDGGYFSPFSSLTRAVQEASQPTRRSPSCTIRVSGSPQVLRSPVRLRGPRASGITIEPSGEEDVLLTAAAPLGEWRKVSRDGGALPPNLWAAKLPPDVKTVRHMWVGGSRCRRPRATPDQLGGVLALTRTGYVVTNTGVARWRNPHHVELLYQARGAYTQQRCPIASVKEVNWTLSTAQLSNTVSRPWAPRASTTPAAEITMAEPCFSNLLLSYSAYQPQIPQGIYSAGIENVFEHLLHPGECYIDHRAGEAYYVSMHDSPPPEAVIPVGGPELLVVEEAADVNVRNVRFEYTTWLEPQGSEGFVDEQNAVRITGSGNPMNKSTFPCVADTAKDTLLPCVPPPAALTLKTVCRLAVTGCTFRHLGAGGIRAEGGVSDVSVSESVFTDLSGSAVSVGSPSTAYAPQWQRDVGVVLSDSVISQCPAEFAGAPAVVGLFVADMRVIRNSISDSAYAAVSVGWGWERYPYSWMRANEISGNRIERYMTGLGSHFDDGGALYLCGHMPGTRITRNYLVGEVQPGDGHGGAIYMDGGLTGVDTAHNVVEAPARQWIYAWIPISCANCTASHNYVRKGLTAVNVVEGFRLRHTVTVQRGATWPWEARVIVSEAGPRCSATTARANCGLLQNSTERNPANE